MRRFKRELYRLPSEGKVAGVCAGIADYFGMETWLIRIITVSGVLLLGGFFLVAYIAAWFILDVKPGYEKGIKEGEGDFRSDSQRSRYDHRAEPQAYDRQESRSKYGEYQQPKSYYGKEKSYSRFDSKPIEVKEKVWQAGEPPRQAFHDIAKQFKDLEKRLQNLETYVTSTEFTVSREINRL